MDIVIIIGIYFLCSFLLKQLFVYNLSVVFICSPFWLHTFDCINLLLHYDLNWQNYVFIHKHKTGHKSGKIQNLIALVLTNRWLDYFDHYNSIIHQFVFTPIWPPNCTVSDSLTDGIWKYLMNESISGHDNYASPGSKVQGLYQFPCMAGILCKQRFQNCWHLNW